MRQFLLIKRNLSHVCKLKPYKDTKWLMPDGNPTGIYIYSCVAGDRVPVILKDPTIATWYSCGPTVYDSTHIGHASCYVKLDIIQRILKSFFNIKLVSAIGITDIDDKIIKKSQQLKTDYQTIAKQYEQEFWLDMANLNVDKPMIIARVSEHINSIENFIKNLIDSNMAYVVEDSSVYFDTSKFPLYGKLQQVQENGEPSDEFKRNKMDFVLWKGQKPGQPSWKTSWGEGRPGWHIECSAMVSKLFGSQLDFHAGGIDLKFPHHENEEAQSCAFHNTNQWANYWIHVGHLNLKDIKMSKSIQNTISIPSLLEKYSADTFRMACLLSNYKHPMEYSDDMMKMAQDIVMKIKFFLKDSNVYVNKTMSDRATYNYKLLNELQMTEERNLEALKADFDTATCVNSLLNLISSANTTIKLNKNEYCPVSVTLIANYIVDMLTKFGLKLVDSSEENISSSVVDTLVDFRHLVRKNAIQGKNKELLTACDIVRDRMKCVKIQINDSDTPSWIYVK
ncbi:probable cysteine--tRNA ligase, mitochondrial [Leptidea sinapis]|uniref:probable cysteine--tRNA ligase, mitochondrial n=1 Tax=Leptidea sinapis TaxID=189913 RepID=UPI00213F6D4C|nr:probable cysteine--tRNA ligase, mitochondrial [Leptidea sinapis]